MNRSHLAGQARGGEDAKPYGIERLGNERR
jgi:hypothetical protein